MNYNKLIIWVEGTDDKRFFDTIVKPGVQGRYDKVEVITYAHMKKSKIRKYISSINAIKGDYIYVRDIDDAPCVKYKKEKTINKVDILDEERIIVVVKEIEGWYLAGISDEYARKLRMKKIKCTDIISKEQFNASIPKRYDSRIDFMVEILKYFSSENAKNKNKSFKYFSDKYNL